MNRANGGLSSLVRSIRSCRPRRQVDISVNTTAPTTNGNHPPSMILTEFAEKNARSTTRKAPITPKVIGIPQRHRRRATDLDDNHRINFPRLQHTGGEIVGSPR